MSDIDEVIVWPERDDNTFVRSDEGHEVFDVSDKATDTRDVGSSCRFLVNVFDTEESSAKSVAKRKYNKKRSCLLIAFLNVAKF